MREGVVRGNYESWETCYDSNCEKNEKKDSFYQNYRVVSSLLMRFKQEGVIRVSFTLLPTD